MPLVRPFAAQDRPPDRIFHACLTELESCSLPARVAQAIHNKDAFKRAEKELAGIRNISGCRLLNWTEPEYPQTLLQIYDPPVLFYLRADPQILNMPCLSIVGTRRPTLYGSQMAERLGRDLAARGLVILSGMARGIDAIGHHGALASNGRAIGVLGTGIDVCYPKENKKLYEKVLERGAILSEFPPWNTSRAREFPDPEWDCRRHAPWSDCDRGGRVQRVLNNSAPRDGIWQRSFWGTGECHPGS